MGSPLVGMTAFKRDVTRALTVGGQRAIQQAANKLAQELPNNIHAIARALDLKAIPASRLRTANLRIAAEAQKAVAEGWRQRLPRNAPSYREGERLTGHLGRVLGGQNQAAMIEGTTARRIEFANVGLLNSEAKHWWRINYGAAGPNLTAAGSHQARTFHVNIQGSSAFNLRDDTPPSGRMFLPHGFGWKGGAYPGGQLHLGKNSAPADVPSAGVRAARFTDLGFEVIAKRLGDVYQEMVIDYVKTEVGRKKFEKLGISVRADLRYARTGVTSS